MDYRRSTIAIKIIAMKHLRNYKSLLRNTITIKNHYNNKKNLY
uniref:Uncharacterized protein n=1 Tax=Bacteriophage sp. TaxID=38018 RepID=A0A8D9PEJ1_9VIRU|nr:MAG TPA: hypothetical protein [Bacteriophage sp.]